jgi:hypothetical protein
MAIRSVFSKLSSIKVASRAPPIRPPIGSYVVQTKGFTKKGNVSLYHGIIKDVYLYPLVNHFRRFLLRQ